MGIEGNPEYSYLHWYAIRTKPRQEERAELNLRTLDLETFAPKIRERRYVTTTAPGGAMQPIEIVKPLFPSYIFARFNASTMLHKVWFTRGVDKVVNFGHTPVIVADEIIALISSRMENEGFVKIEPEIAAGDKVRIKAGPLSNFVGVFAKNASAAKRIKLLLSAVNYQCRIEIDRDLVEKVS